MMRNKLMAGVVVALTIGGTVAASTTPAAVWCRWGRCGWGGGWGGPVAAGAVAGAAFSVAAAAARPYPTPYYRPGGYFVCPQGYHFGPQGRACWAN